MNKMNKMNKMKLGKSSVKNVFVNDFLRGMGAIGDFLPIAKIKPKTINQNSAYTNFWKGYASTFDLYGQIYPEIADINIGFERDKKALTGDWQRIGNDMRSAIHQVIYEKK